MSSLAQDPISVSRERLGGCALRSAWNDLKTQKKGMRARDSAEALGVSEAELIASLIGDGGTRLRTDGAQIIKDIPALGPVMALTRNESCVHEKIGPYTDVSINPGHGLVLGKEIDLRIFPAHWRHVFALVEDTDNGPRRCIQIFDAAGTAVHKIYQKPATDIAAFDALIDRWRAEDQTPTLTVLPPLSKRSDRVRRRDRRRTRCVRIGALSRTRTISSGCCATSMSDGFRRCGSPAASSCVR